MRELVESLRALTPLREVFARAYKHARDRSKVWTKKSAALPLIESGMEPKSVARAFAALLLEDEVVADAHAAAAAGATGFPSDEVFESILFDIVWERVEVGIRRVRRN